MRLTRRLFATLIFAVAPFVGASVVPFPEVKEGPCLGQWLGLD